MKQKNETIAERIVKLRTAYGLSQNQFALRAGLTRIGIRNLEESKALKPQFETVAAISNTYGTTPEWITNGVGEMLPNGKALLITPGSDTKGNYYWKDEAYNLMKHRAESAEMQLQRVWAIVNHVTGGKLPGFRKATEFAGFPLLWPITPQSGGCSVAQA